MPPVNQKRLLARAPKSAKTEAGVKALVSVFFSFLSPLPAFAKDELAPEATFAALRCFCPTALTFLPGAKPTACTRRQPHVCEGKTLL